MEERGGLLYFVHLVDVILLIAAVCLEADILAKRPTFYRLCLRRALLLFDQDILFLMAQPAIKANLMTIFVAIRLWPVESVLCG